MARVMLGFYVGFFVAAFELMEYITSVQETAYAPLICLVFYLIAAIFILDEDQLFWGFVLISLITFLIYCFGMSGHVNFTENASLHRDHSNPDAS
jgi:hypothetical protein